MRRSAGGRETLVPFGRQFARSAHASSSHLPPSRCRAGSLPHNRASVTAFRQQVPKAFRCATLPTRFVTITSPTPVFDRLGLRSWTVTATQTAMDQLNYLLGQRDELASRSKYSDLSDFDPGSRVLANRLQAAIDRLTVPASTYGRAAELQRHNEYFAQRLTELVGIATALRDDIQAGWLTSVVELTHAETYAGYLEMADGLVAQHYKDAAAVIAGTSLEVQLKALATKHGVSLQAPNGGQKKASVLNDDLKREGVYNALEHKQVTAWLAMRNSAAHGNYADYNETAVKGLVEGVGNFAAK